MEIQLEHLGYTRLLKEYRENNNLESFMVGRVISEHKDRYIVRTESGEYQSELIGSLRFNAETKHDLPAVGDWVALSEYDTDKALIHGIYPRLSLIERKAIGKSSQTQIIASNIDFGLIVQAINRDFNINRLERYLTICNASKVEPIIILSKIDLIDEKTLSSFLTQIKERIPDTLIIAISNHTSQGLDRLSSIIEKGKTYCLLGSSGVGKSTLINTLSGENLMDTGEISESIDRGKHVTSHRELFVLKSGGIIIDNPGMREVGIADASGGLEMTFDKIYEYAQQCKFKDCTHTHETTCAVIEAVEKGEIDQDAYHNFHKMEKEIQHYETDAVERRRKDKEFGKMIKQVLKNKRKNKY